jgi:hypothetical protein
MRDSRVGCAPASHATAPCGEEGSVGGRWRFPDAFAEGEDLMDIRTIETWTPVRVKPRHPTRWWRSHLAQVYDERTIRRMRAFLAKVDLPAEERWFDAATGEAAAAIAVAFNCRTRVPAGRDYDMAMTALAVCAFRGNAAARLVIARHLRWLPGGGDAAIRVADSWIAYRPAADRDCGRRNHAA